MSAPWTDRRSPDAQRAHRRTWWLDALTSLWAPLTILALALVPYLLVVGLAPDAAAWAQPLMKGFALVMVIEYVGLFVARLTLPPLRTARRARHDAEELLGEVSTALKRGKLEDEALRERVIAQGAALDDAALEGDPGRIGVESRKLSDLAEKHLPHFRKNPTGELVLGLVKALAVALLIRAVLIEPYRIPSGSMIPTLEVGDQIFVNKFIYGVRFPFINWVPFTIVRPPARGDVIVFSNPVNDEDFIKRIAGIPGDRVELIHDTVYVNGVAQERKLLDPQYPYWDYRDGEWSPGSARRYQETLGPRPHVVLQEGGRLGSQEGPFIVPPGHVFVLGDNRDHSLDSRYGLGAPDRQVQYVPFGNIKGKAMIIWLSLAHGGFLSRWTGGAGLRTDRLFQPVQ